MTHTPEQQQTLNDVLRHAVDHDDKDMIRLSLERGADANQYVTMIAGSGALVRTDAALLQLSLRKGADPGLLLYAGMQVKSLAVVKLAVEQGAADVNGTHTAPGKSDIYGIGDWSYRCFNEDISNYLIGKGMKVDMPDGSGATPLLRAVRDQNYSRVLHYISHAADPLAADKEGKFPLSQLQGFETRYGGTFAERKDEMLKAMLKNMAEEPDTAPATPAPTPAFNGVSTKPIEVSHPLELKKKQDDTPTPEHPAKGFKL